VYWKTSNYPSLQGLTRKEQQHIVTCAIRKSGKAIGYRFLIATVVLLAVPIVIANFERIPNWSSYLLVAPAGALFYLYILWEINGPIFKAVKTYQADENTI